MGRTRPEVLPDGVSPPQSKGLLLSLRTLAQCSSNSSHDPPVVMTSVTECFARTQGECVGLYTSFVSAAKTPMCLLGCDVNVYFAL